MGAHEKKFLVNSIVLTVITLILMTVVAIVFPKDKFKTILVIEIVLALFWTIICTINVIRFLKANKK